MRIPPSLRIIGDFLHRSAPAEQVWAPDQRILPEIELHGDVAHVRNIRNFHYRAVDDYTAGYYNGTYDARAITGLWYFIIPFSRWRGVAHTILSFEFEDGRFLAISIEIRKRRKGEEYVLWKGLLLPRHYRLMYVIGDERDLVKLRTNHRKNHVFLYRISAAPSVTRPLFLSLLRRAQASQERPEHYRLFTNSCTTAVVRQVNVIAPGTIPRSHKVFLPAFSDRLAYDLGLLDCTVPFERLREQSCITTLAQRIGDDPEFSLKIRGR